MLYYMNSDTGKVIAREIGDEPFSDLWFEISKEEYEETLHPLSPANTGLQADGAKSARDGVVRIKNIGGGTFVDADDPRPAAKA